MGYVSEVYKLIFLTLKSLICTKNDSEVQMRGKLTLRRVLTESLIEQQKTLNTKKSQEEEL